MKFLIGLALFAVILVGFVAYAEYAEAFEGKVKFQSRSDYSEQGDIIVYGGIIVHYYTPEITITIFEKHNPDVVVIVDTVKIEENAEFTNEVSDRLWPFSYEVDTGDSRLSPETSYMIHAVFEDKNTSSGFNFNPPMAQQVITESTNPIYNNTPEQAENDNTSKLIKETKVPSWVKNLFVMYAEDKIDDNALINALQFLIKSGILVV